METLRDAMRRLAEIISCLAGVWGLFRDVKYLGAMLGFEELNCLARSSVATSEYFITPKLGYQKD